MIPKHLLHTIAGLFLFSAISLHAQGKLEILGGDTHDWGNVAPGKLTAVVELKNVGSGDLKIVEVRPTCLCTIAPFDKNLLKPGEISKVDITLDATSKSGLVERNIIIRTSDSATPQQTLHLKAMVKRDLTFSPAQALIIRDAHKDVESAAEQIVVTNTASMPITIYTPGAPQGNIKSRFDMPEQVTLKPGENFVLKGFITPLAATGMTGTIKMKTSSQQMPYIDLTIAGTMAGGDASQSH
jgi:hypothetical protein